MNTTFDEIKPYMCQSLTDTAEDTTYDNYTCTEMKEVLGLELDVMGSMFELSEDVTKSFKSLTNTWVDSACDSNDKRDLAKAKIIASDIKGMFC